MIQKIFYALPYSNGQLHLGHLASCVVPSNILYRAFKTIKNKRSYLISGSDQFGTPILVEAKKKKVSSEALSESFHVLNKDLLTSFGFSTEFFFKTNSPDHIRFVQKFFRKLKKEGHIEKKITSLPFCSFCNLVLSSRFLEGACLTCKRIVKNTKECSECGAYIRVLSELSCSICKRKISKFKKENHFYLTITEQEKEEVFSFLKQKIPPLYFHKLKKELADYSCLCISRTLPWGVPLSKTKVFFVWFEALLSYFSFVPKRSKKETFFFGKDNVFFHCFLLPLLYLKSKKKLSSISFVISEFLLFGQSKFSKSSGVPPIFELNTLKQKFGAETIIGFLLYNLPKLKDSECTEEKLLSFSLAFNHKLCNLLHRVFSFYCSTAKVFDFRRKTFFKEILSSIFSFDIKQAYFLFFEKVSELNKTFSKLEPWKKKSTKETSFLNSFFSFFFLLEIFHPSIFKYYSQYVNTQDKTFFFVHQEKISPFSRYSSISRADDL